MRWPSVVLRELGVLVQLHHARVLGRRDVGIADAHLEDRAGALVSASQQVADLLFDAVRPLRRTRRGFRLLLFLCDVAHRPPPLRTLGYTD